MEEFILSFRYSRKILMKKYRCRLASFAVLLILFGCASRQEIIRDIRILPQDPASYISAPQESREHLTVDRQEELDRRFNDLFFASWRRTDPHYSREIILRKHTKYLQNPGFGENKLPRETKSCRTRLSL
jgi:hypothetical protein